MSGSFDDILKSNDPVQLTMFVWNRITAHFGLSGCAVHTKMRKTDLDFQQDDSGEFIVLSKDFASKTMLLEGLQQASSRPSAVSKLRNKWRRYAYSS